MPKVYIRPKIIFYINHKDDLQYTRHDSQALEIWRKIVRDVTASKIVVAHVAAEN